MEYTIAERIDLHSRILEDIILNPEKLPDTTFPDYEHKIGIHPISAINNTGFIVRETFDNDEHRNLFVEINIQNSGFEYIKYSIPTNKSGRTELLEVAKAKITYGHYIIEEVIMNDYRDKDFLTPEEIEKIKVMIIHVTTMLLLYAYQMRMQYGLLSIPEGIDEISIIDNFKENSSKSEENDEKASEKEYEEYRKALDSVKDELKIELETFVQKQYFDYKKNITSEVADLLENAEINVKNNVSDTFHERFTKLEESNEKISDSLESINCDMTRFKTQMAEYTMKMFREREDQMMERIIEKLKNPEENNNPIAELVKAIEKDKDELRRRVIKSAEVDEDVVFNCNCKDIFAKLSRISREMMAKASSTCHQGSEIAFQETINMRGDIDQNDFKTILNSPYAKACNMTNFQRKCIEEGSHNSYHMSCTIDSFLSGAVLYRFIVRDNLLYPNGMEVTFTFNDNHDLCTVENTLRGYDEFKHNLLTRYLMCGAKTDAWLFRELMNIGTDLRKRYEKEVENHGK